MKASTIRKMRMGDWTSYYNQSFALPPAESVGAVVHTSAEVEAHINKLDPAFESTNRAVFECTELDPTTRANWITFYGSWLLYKKQPILDWNPLLGPLVSYQLGVETAYENGQKFQADLHKWQESLKGKCTLKAPSIDPPKDETKETHDTIRTVAIAAAVLVGGLAAIKVLGK